MSGGEQCPARITALVKKWVMEFVCGLFPDVEEAKDPSECLGFFSAKKVK